MRGFATFMILLFIAACGSDSSEEVDQSAHLKNEAVGKSNSNPLSNDGKSDQGIEIPTEKEMENIFEESATKFAKSFREGDFKTFISYMHPTLVRAQGGSMEFEEKLKTMQNPEEVNAYRKWEVGPVRAIKEVKDKSGKHSGWYCVIPVTRWLKNAPDSVAQQQWLAGQSLNQGRNCYFMDITGTEEQQAYQIMPDLRFLFEDN
jgi:hypothetical protein